MVTIKEIASAVGVSSATVSRVLNFDATLSVTPQKRQAIIETAEAMNYATPRARNRAARQGLSKALNDPSLLGRSLFRTAIFLPCVTSLVAYSVLFKSMFAVDGVVNDLLLAIHVIGQPIPWLADAFWAKVLIILAITWRWTGYNMIFYLAAMQNIDRSIYEAARIDGVPAWARFVYITVPMLKPVILFTSVISTIGTLQLFDEANNITLGGPSDATLTLSLYIYNLTFKFMPSFGYAATVSYVIVVVVGLLSFLQFFVARERRPS